MLFEIAVAPVGKKNKNEGRQRQMKGESEKRKWRERQMKEGREK